MLGVVVGVGAVAGVVVGGGAVELKMREGSDVLKEGSVKAFIYTVI